MFEQIGALEGVETRTPFDILADKEDGEHEREEDRRRVGDADKARELLSFCEIILGEGLHPACVLKRLAFVLRGVGMERALHRGGNRKWIEKLSAPGVPIGSAMRPSSQARMTGLFWPDGAERQALILRTLYKLRHAREGRLLFKESISVPLPFIDAEGRGAAPLPSVSDWEAQAKFMQFIAGGRAWNPLQLLGRFYAFAYFIAPVRVELMASASQSDLAEGLLGETKQWFTRRLRQMITEPFGIYTPGQRGPFACEAMEKAARGNNSRARGEGGA